MAADGNKAPGASAGELAGASWRWVACRPSPTRPRPGDAAAPPLSTVSPAFRQCPLQSPPRLGPKLFVPWPGPKTQDFSLQPPCQELIARDLHDNEWKFRHIFRAQQWKEGCKGSDAGAGPSTPPHPVRSPQRQGPRRAI